MLMNARPRYVSNGFETFIVTQQGEVLHQSLVEMKKEDINARDAPRPVATYQTDSWDQQLDDFNGSEKDSWLAPCNGYFKDTAGLIDNQAINVQMTPGYSAVYQQHLFSRRPSGSQHIYHEPVSKMVCLENQSPMLGEDNSWSHGHRNGSFAEFANTRNGLGDFSSLSSTKNEPTPYASLFSLMPQQTAYQEVTSEIADSLNVNRASPSTVYSSYSSSGPSVDPSSLAYSSISATSDMSFKASWWPGSSNNSKEQYQNFGIPISHHGLPTTNGQYDYGEVRSGISDTWVQHDQPTGSATITPTSLTLPVQPTASSSSMSSPASLQLHFSPSPSTSASCSSEEEFLEFSTPESMNVIVPKAALCRPRQILPDSAPDSRRVLPSQPSNKPPRKMMTRKQSQRSLDTYRCAKASSPLNGTIRSLTKSPRLVKPASYHPSVPKRIEPKPESQSATQSWAEKPQSAETVQATHNRDSRDDFLVKSKLAGIPYKEIRRQGNFTEAESTLRGRFRTLTKHKAARVRKPEWSDNDIHLLKKAVGKLTPNSEISKGKVPWKQVAEYIANNGGSYHFGNATCRKRWDKLQAQP